MSSDNSSVLSGSRIRQFGLYRTIDARTEEFLRLSRKRQIRQGCACAAASTAITVTVVIVVFFVYEFSLNSETNIENSLKSNWLSLMNDTSENSSFDSKITNANIDRTTLKFLPLLIKAIKKNVFLEKFLEDHSSSSPSYEKKEAKETTEEGFEPNAFSNTWFKMPTTKLFAIEYKTSPVLLYRNPTRNLEYYTKIRKIRDYQRVFNYVDKMISKKVYIRPTSPMPKGEMLTDKPPTRKNVPFKKTTSRSKIHPKTLEITEISEEPKLQCKCSKKLGEVLKKILLNIQKLFPDTNGNRPKLMDCIKTENSRSTTTIREPIASKKKLFNMFTRFSTSKPLLATLVDPITSTLNIMPQKTRTFAFETELVTQAYNDINSSTETNSYEETTITTQAMFINKYKNIIHRKQLLRNPENKLIKTVTESIFDGIEYDDYSYSTQASQNKDHIHNNMINFVQTKLNYLNKIDGKLKKTKNKIPLYKKLTKIILGPRESTIKDSNVVDNKIVLVKTRPIVTNKLNNKSNQNETNTTHKQINYDVTTPRPLTTLRLLPEEKILKKVLNIFNMSTINSNEILDKYTLKTTKLPIEFMKLNLATPKISYFDYVRYPKNNKTTYRVKTDKKSFLSNIFIKPKRFKSNFKTSVNNRTNTSDDLKRSSYSKLNTSKSIINHTRSVLETNVTSAKFQESKEKTYENTGNTSTTSEKDKEKQGSELFEEDIEFVTGDFSDITRQPDNTLEKPENNSYIHKKDNYELTWEDLTNEYIPAGRSMIPAYRPLTYLEYHKTHDKPEEHQDEDYNINSMFYDLNI